MSKVVPDEQNFSLELKKRFSTSLKRVMFEFELSNKELASSSGVDSTYISHLRSGTRLPNFENFIKIFEAFSDPAQEYFLFLLFAEKGKMVVKQRQYIEKKRKMIQEKNDKARRDREWTLFNSVEISEKKDTTIK